MGDGAEAGVSCASLPGLLKAGSVYRFAVVDNGLFNLPLPASLVNFTMAPEVLPGATAAAPAPADVAKGRAAD